ncbi:MAG: hypothetical protein KDD63_00395, partial [Bacteroidetes bacterium]|nr:hypothetical protein [Bacteroidota bacterium]
VRKLEEKEARLQRHFEPNNPTHLAEQTRLQQEKNRANRAILSNQNKIGNLRGELNKSWADFLDFSDPGKNLGQLNDNYPILMLPLRIETRFKKVNADGRVRDELWVRVFPDDCSIDTFEEHLSNSEILNAQDFWTNW